MSAHLRRRGRHRAARDGIKQVFALPAAGTLAPAALGLVLTAGVVGAPPGADEGLFEPVAASTAAATAASPYTPLGLPEQIEGFAAYIAQSRCDPNAKPGVLAFRDLVLRTYRDTGSDGIVRACNIGGVSEHKEGRAWDWQVSANNRHQVAEVRAFMSWLLATDDEGHRAAMARRLGVMYMIWNRRIWSSSKAGDGWRAYHGAEAHMDHVHFSFSWPGAMKKTSFWHATGIGRISAVELRRYRHSMLSYGSRGGAVRVVQRALGVRPANGVYGSKTRTAVIRFQQAHHLRGDGVLGPKTWSKFQAPTPPQAPNQPQARTRSPQATPVRRLFSTVLVQHYTSHVLRVGARGPAVEAVQRIIHQKPDGQYRTATARSVAKWQRQYRLTPDGVVGKRTWGALVARVQRVERRAHAAEVARAKARAHALAVAHARERRARINRYHASVLRPGAQGPAVTFVQQRLHMRRDGVYGTQTQVNVAAFQRRHHLHADGVVGPRTWRAVG
jgi:peptidoglycan hydrolase-like protein with peptidoglycan-binding domain